MSAWLVVWLIVGLTSTAAVLVAVVALVRHVVIVGRAAREMQEAVAPLAQEIAAQGDRASSRMRGVRPPGSKGRG